MSTMSNKNVVSSPLTAVNHSAANSLALSAQPGTDILHRASVPELARNCQFTAPILKSALKISSFDRARVTIHYPASAKTEFDQAGLVFIRPQAALPCPNAANEGTEDSFPYFVKAGIEAFQGEILLAVTGSKHTHPEWSLWPLPSNAIVENEISVVVEIMRHGPMLGIFSIERDANNERKRLIRIIPWCFADEEEQEADIWVGLYAARPDLKRVGGSNALDVHFSDFELITR